MIIPITLVLEDGELEVFQAELAAYNAANGTTLDEAAFGALKLQADAHGGKMRAIDAKAMQLADLSKQLPDEKRLEFTAAVETLYQEIATRP